MNASDKKLLEEFEEMLIGDFCLLEHEILELLKTIEEEEH